MYPALHTKAKDGAALARVIASEIGASSPVAKAAAALAADCLELAVSPFSWQQSHDIARDLGVRSLRESVLRDCAAALLIAADAARRLGVHGASAERHSAISSRLEQLSADLMRAGAGLDQCEEKIIERLAEPRLAEISLEDRAKNMRSEPSLQTNRIKRLSAELEEALAEAAESRATVSAHESQLAQAREQLRSNETMLTAISAELERLELEKASALRALSDTEFARDDLRQCRESAIRRLEQVRTELEGMRSDPRDSIRDAVHRALALLPSDAFDRAVGGTHEG
jgi:hypothetical protein